MFLDRIWKGKEQEGPALALVSFAVEEGEWGAVADQEYRYRPTLTPGGYRWCPRQGEEVLLLPTAGGELCAGVTGDSQGLTPGEVRIEGPGGGYIWLRADGTVVVNGQEFPPAQ